MVDNQKRIYSTKRHHSVKTECRVIVLFLCTSSDEAMYLYKFHEYILNGFRDVKHKSKTLMVLKNDTMDTILKLNTSKGIILLKFRCSYDSCSLQIYLRSEHYFQTKKYKGK